MLIFQGSKKLDKAEIIEFTIQYVKKLHSQRTGMAHIDHTKHIYTHTIHTSHTIHIHVHDQIHCLTRILYL